MLSRNWRSWVVRSLGFLALMVFPWSAWVDAQVNIPFRIGFSADQEMRAPLLVKFQAIFPPEYRVQWTLGDGTQQNTTKFEHTYYRAGTYEVQAELFDSRGRVVSRANGKVEVKTNGPERTELTVLLGNGEVRLSAAESVLYSPTTPQLLLNGQEVGSRPIKLSPGKYNAVSRATTLNGKPVERQVTFSVATWEGSVPFETEVLRLTNRARARGWNCTTLREGGPPLPPLQQHAALDTAALAQSAAMALYGYFDHTSALDGSTPRRRILATGLHAQASAENIAAGQESPAEVVDGWLRSPGHCKNIMGDFNWIGLSYVSRPASKYKLYWTQVFAKM